MIDLVSKIEFYVLYRLLLSMSLGYIFGI